MRSEIVCAVVSRGRGRSLRPYFVNCFSDCRQQRRGNRVPVFKRTRLIIVDLFADGERNARVRPRQAARHAVVVRVEGSTNQYDSSAMQCGRTWMTTSIPKRSRDIVN